MAKAGRRVREGYLRYESGGGGEGVWHGDQGICEGVREVVAWSGGKGMPLCSGVHEKF